MLGLHVTVPIACFRKGLAREYLETESVPTPATCYGFLLSLVGESRRARHVGCRVCPVLVDPVKDEPRTQVSVVLRTVWRCKDRNYWVDPSGTHHVVSTTKKERDAFIKWVRSKGWPEPEFEVGLGSGTNARPDYQQLLSPVTLILWLDSQDESTDTSTLEQRVRNGMENPALISRFGGLSLGESTHLVDEVDLFPGQMTGQFQGRTGRAFLRRDRGRLTLPVWVDHVGSAGTSYVTGDLVQVASLLESPPLKEMPRIHPEGLQE